MIVNVLVDGVHRLPIQAISNHRSDIIDAISQALNQSPTEFYLIQNGKLLGSDSDSVDSIDVKHLNGPICVHQRAFGGKGGFGSMLRAIGAQIEKTTNREACRDLSGRRLRDINEEKRLKEYLEKQKDRQDDESAKIARKIERLRSKPKHEFSDTEYFETRSNLLDDVSNALEDGLKKAAVAGTSSSKAATATATSTTSAISSGTESSRDQDSSSSSSNDGHAEATATNANHKRKNLAAADKKLKAKKKKKNVKGALWLDEGLSSGDSSSDGDDDDDDDDNKDGSNTNSSSTKTAKK